MPENVQKAFIGNRIVPDMLDKPPKAFLRVKLFVDVECRDRSNGMIPLIRSFAGR